MEEHPRIAPQRQYIEGRAEELLERIPYMRETEMYWTVRVLRDCLPPPAQAAMLRDYSEHLEVHQLRHVVKGFVPAYTAHALAALEAKRFGSGASLGDFTDEELQAMSAAEKWDLLRRDAATLQPYQVRRELARLFMCHTFDLFHDPSLGEAAVEFTVYLDLLERLGALPDGAIEGLKDHVLAVLEPLDGRDVAAVERALSTLREAIGRPAGLIPPFDALFGERMRPWPPGPPEALGDVVDPEIREAVGEMNLRELRTSLRVLVELMSLEEQQQAIEPLRAAYRSLGDIPAEALADLLPRLSMRLGDRGLCDFALRYRSGRLWAREGVDPRVWSRLPFQDKFMLLEADNEAMDLLQASRHLARLLLTERYELLFDPAYQVGLTDRRTYRRLLDSCMRTRGDSAQLETLNRQATRMMLELEVLVPEAGRAGRFLEIREVIGAGLKFGPMAGEG